VPALLPICRSFLTEKFWHRCFKSIRLCVYGLIWQLTSPVGLCKAKENMPRDGHMCKTADVAVRMWLWVTASLLSGLLLPDPFAPAFGNTSGIKIQLNTSKNCDGKSLFI
jgi:polyferredoxin